MAGPAHGVFVLLGGSTTPKVADLAPRGKVLAPENPRVGAYRLRARIRRLAPSARERQCGLIPVAHATDHPEVVVRCDEKTGERRARWAGILTCGHVWTCPVCSSHLRSERAERIALAVEFLKGRWQLLTLTIAHHRGMQLKPTIAGIMRAVRRMKQGGAVQRLWGEKVTASVRTLEVMHGQENGWHPHVHILLRTEEWDALDRAVLLRRWQDCVARELGEDARPSNAQALTWSDAFDGAEGRNRSLYVTKLGLEVAGIAKTGKRGNLTSWGVAEKAAQNSSEHVWLWREFHAATRGRRMIEMDDRMSDAAKAGAEEKAYAALEATAADASTEAPPQFPTTRIRVMRDDLRALRMQENAGRHWILAAVLSAAEERGELGVHAWVQWAREKARPTPGLDLGGEGAEEWGASGSLDACPTSQTAC